MLDTIFLAFALAMDAFAVALALACVAKKLRIADYLGIPSAFGLFQFMMPLIGYFFSSFVQESLSGYGTWIAGILLAGVGVKMLKESLEKNGNEQNEGQEKITFLCILFLAVATSIDALTIGISFSLIGREIFIPSIIIGVVCFACTFVALRLGVMLSGQSRLGKRAELLGGCILIGIAMRILFF